MHDYGSGLDMDSFKVTADSPSTVVRAGQNLAGKFKALPDNRWELKLAKPLPHLPKGKLTVSVKDRQGNVARIERTILGRRSRPGQALTAPVRELLCKQRTACRFAAGRPTQTCS